MKQIFDNYIETSFDKDAQALFKYDLFEHNYRKYFPSNKTAKILDIGIGRGEMLGCMRKWGYENYNGVDISPSTVKHCVNLGLRCERVDDTADYLKKNKNSFEVVTLLDVLEHVPREAAVELLKAIQDSLTEKGVVIIQVPNLQAPFAYLHHFNDITHVTGYVEHSLAQVLLAAGFDKYDFHGLDEFYQVDFKTTLKKILRPMFQRVIRVMRAINANPNPTILDPVFFVVARR